VESHEEVVKTKYVDRHKQSEVFVDLMKDNLLEYLSDYLSTCHLLILASQLVFEYNEARKSNTTINQNSEVISYKWNIGGC
jgi:hypothetical protein